jgi:hypothetical protein
LIGFMDIARVYVNSSQLNFNVPDIARANVGDSSPGGWHKGFGAGFWVGFVNPGTSINVLFTNNPDRRIVSSLGFAF